MLSESFLLSVRDILLENDHTNELHNKLLQHGFKLNPGTDNMYSHPKHPNSTIGLMGNTTHERLQRHFDKFGIKPEHNANSSEQGGKLNALYNQLNRAGYQLQPNSENIFKHPVTGDSLILHGNESSINLGIKLDNNNHDHIKGVLKDHLNQNGYQHIDNYVYKHNNGHEINLHNLIDSHFPRGTGLTQPQLDNAVGDLKQQMSNVNNNHMSKLHDALRKGGYHHEGKGRYTLAGADDIHINNNHTYDDVKSMVASGHGQVRSKIINHIKQHSKKLGITNPQTWVANNAVHYPDPHDDIRNDHDGDNNRYNIKPHEGFNAHDIEHSMNSYYVKHSGMSPTEENARKIIATKQYLDGKGFIGGTKGIYGKKGVVGEIDSTKGLEYVKGQIESHEEFNKNFAIHHNGDIIHLEHQKKVGNIYDEKILNNDVKSNLRKFNATIENHNKEADSLGISPKLLLGHDITDIMDRSVTIPSKDNLAKKGLHIVSQNENKTVVYHENSPHVKHTIEHHPPQTRSIFTSNPFHNVDKQMNEISKKSENNYNEPSKSDIKNANATRQSIKSGLSGMGINLNISSNANRVEDGLKNAHQSAINSNHPKVIASLAANKDVSVETLHNLSKHPMLNYDAINNIIDNPNTNRDIMKNLINHPNVTKEHMKMIVNHPKIVE